MTIVTCCRTPNLRWPSIIVSIDTDDDHHHHHPSSILSNICLSWIAYATFVLYHKVPALFSSFHIEKMSKKKNKKEIARLVSNLMKCSWLILFWELFDKEFDSMLIKLNAKMYKERKNCTNSSEPKEIAIVLNSIFPGYQPKLNHFHFLFDWIEFVLLSSHRLRKIILWYFYYLIVVRLTRSSVDNLDEAGPRSFPNISVSILRRCFLCEHWTRGGSVIRVESWKGFILLFLSLFFFLQFSPPFPIFFQTEWNETRTIKLLVSGTYWI